MDMKSVEMDMKSLEEVRPVGLTMQVLIGSILTISPRTGNLQCIDPQVCFVVR